VEIGLEFGCGDGSAGRSSGRADGDVVVTWSEMPRSPGHVFYDRLQQVRVGAGFDGFVEDACRAYDARTMGAPSVPPGRYFRMHMVGDFEGIDSERGIEWRCSASLSLREFLRLESPPGEPPAGSRSCVAVKDTRPSAP
jgi:transposase